MNSDPEDYDSADDYEDNDNSEVEEVDGEEEDEEEDNDSNSEEVDNNEEKIETKDNDEEEEEEEEEDEEENEKTLRNELSKTPFEELLKLSDKMGTKRYHETIVTKFTANNEQKKVIQKNNNNERIMKRANKNRPQEISSKRPVSQLRKVFPIKKKNVETDDRIDPRFDDRSGKYSESVFNKTYSFINDMRDKELNELKKMLKKTKNEEKRKELQFLLQRMKNQKISHEMKQKKKQIETNIRNKLKEELTDKDSDDKSLSKKRKKTFVNKSTLKRLELVERFKDLKKSGKLDKYLEKKRKRNAMRERKKIMNNKTKHR
ncbi:ribosomal RNA processing protein 36 homolog [Oppia nitens]|uniref:ribosomal RNA processing protein 36 homolog n=1 Tax=Oppia nitens TaxID=1686743 RepID=UPI0023D9F942|nr:ribosomal RNA processing protein 36 homolog [Oppia nitens]